MARLTCLALLASVAAARALIIQLDYTYDVADGGNFFGSNAVARAALEKAATDLGAAILPSLAAVTTDVFNGASGGGTASIDWALDFDNPVTTSTVTLNTFTFAAETVRLFVGMRQLGSTLGVGGPGGVAVAFGAGGTAAGRVTAFNNAAAASNSMMQRGGGPVIGDVSGSFNTGGGTAPYSLNYGAMIGAISFDIDTNWNFNATGTVPSGTSDFYSVALHEIMHAIGFGTSDTWSAKRSGTTWTGANAIAIAGSGTNLVAASGHIAEGVMSFRQDGGGMQEAAMDPTLTVGTRKVLTQLDLAILRDIGYATVPEPSTAMLLAAAALVISQRRSRRPAPCAGRSGRHS
ncbi:MAG: PEP-CTERM sorting domain-containing protein [Chthoniobacteraceae bacterium]